MHLHRRKDTTQETVDCASQKTIQHPQYPTQKAKCIKVPRAQRLPRAHPPCQPGAEACHPAHIQQNGAHNDNDNGDNSPVIRYAMAQLQRTCHRQELGCSDGLVD